MKIKVIARTTDENIYLVRVGGPKHGHEYLEVERRIPESAFPKTRAGYDRIPLSSNVAYNAELYPKHDCIRLES
jgi:hypothetical protein